ncbi:hypothetical protein FQR65_LT19618 [Abscondita terminalis]|nr:hypothetical protein FQR65_LT19618 [Abscondita terminalis]
MIEKNYITNIIFYGVPGIGKTSLAQAICYDLGYDFVVFNASNDNKEKLKSFVEKNEEKKMILIIDEIHRMTKNIQDFLLEYIEKNTFIIFATTTENPFFVVNPAIRSRCQILELNEISNNEMVIGLKNVFKQNQIFLNIDDDAFKYVCQLSSGDLRVAINYFEILLNLYNDNKIDLNIISKVIQKAHLRGYKDGDDHFDILSAFHKSLRGSDVDASLHYFARLLESNDMEGLFRRMIMVAYEDIGLANPMIAVRVKTAIDNFRQVGMPEGRLILGMAVIEMALSEKSNSVISSVDTAIQDIHKGKSFNIPSHLKDNHYSSAHKLNRGVNYKYPHDYQNHFIEQQYLPDSLLSTKYFEFNNSTYEKKIQKIQYQPGEGNELSYLSMLNDSFGNGITFGCPSKEVTEHFLTTLRGVSNAEIEVLPPSDKPLLAENEKEQVVDEEPNRQDEHKDHNFIEKHKEEIAKPISENKL